MPTTPEGKVKAEVDKLLKKYNVWYFKPVSLGYGKHGIPDYICCVKGKFVGIETKRKGVDPKVLQERQADAIRKAEGIVLTIKPDNLYELEITIKTLTL